MHDDQESCYKKEDYSQILSCVEQFTRNRTSLIKQVGIEDSPVRFNVSDKWIPGYGIIMKGRMFTLNSSYRLSDKFYTYFSFESAPGASVQIQIHDPTFFLDHSEKLKDFQTVRLGLEKGKQYTLNLDIVEYQILDTERRKCQTDGSYSFRACIQVNSKDADQHMRSGNDIFMTLTSSDYMCDTLTTRIKEKSSWKS